MALSVDDKKRIVADISSFANDSSSLVLADARGLNVFEANQLRSEGHKSNVKFVVVKNTLVKLAFKGTIYEGLDDYLTGLKYKLEIYCPLDDEGSYINDGQIPETLIGQSVLEKEGSISDANRAVFRKQCLTYKALALADAAASGAAPETASPRCQGKRMKITQLNIYYLCLVLFYLMITFEKLYLNYVINLLF